MASLERIEKSKKKKKKDIFKTIDIEKLKPILSQYLPEKLSL